ncbi:hypothetical protein D3C84_1029070 [compost metagenome]
MELPPLSEFGLPRIARSQRRYLQRDSPIRLNVWVAAERRLQNDCLLSRPLRTECLHRFYRDGGYWRSQLPALSFHPRCSGNGFL